MFWQILDSISTTNNKKKESWNILYKKYYGSNTFIVF